MSSVSPPFLLHGILMAPLRVLDDLNLDYEVPLDGDLNQFGIGVIGAGFIVRDCHLVAYQQAGFRVLGIASRNPERAAEVAATRGIPATYAHYREMLSNPEIQVLDIGVPPQFQPGIIREIVKTSRNVRGIL